MLIVRKRLRIFLGILFLVASMVAQGMERAADAAAYDSDSEDERGYQYRGYDHLRIPEKPGKQVVAFCRDIHFSPTFFSKEQRSRFRKKDEVGQPIFSSAVYDAAGVTPTDDLDHDKIEALARHARTIKELITRLNGEGHRDSFQQLYTNHYDTFHSKLAQRGGVFKHFLSSKNPQVSTSENFRHPGKYGCGKKFLGERVQILDPEYDFDGKPKHPYLGKTYIVLVDTNEIGELDPYFVAWGHANGKVKIFTHHANNILTEREVSFPGFIPGRYVVFAKPVRVPSFKGDYKPYYGQKYGMSERSYTILKGKLARKKAKDGLEETELKRKRAVTVNTIIEKVINHTAARLEAHVKKECTDRGITLVYKSLVGGFSEHMPTIDEVKDARL